ncbi:hypothetical protein HPB49_011286 [Dermacentor silvarum]|uniref:Uncharacterized protein n=1 Tax=Dermacentor silvarum TaxID=543639 RepID=A0ACB8CQZ6_DERSI|nr:hypothetical protein HPB49_011286 [Dermacentor silvarum]
MFEEDPLRNLLDVVVENTSESSMQVLELAAETSHSLLAPWVAALISLSNTLLSIEYTIVHARPETLSPGQVPKGVAVVALNSPASGTKLAKSDLVVMRSATWASNSIQSLAEELSSICKENGFVLLAQRTVLTPAEAVISAALELEFEVHSSAAVESAFLTYGMRLVGLKSNRVCALLLFRKRSLVSPSLQPEVIWMNGIAHTCIDALKNKILEYEGKPTAEKLWLCSQEPGRSGVIGVTNCLRKDAGGSHVRCVLAQMLVLVH